MAPVRFESGKAIALRLARDGFDICINDLKVNSNSVEDVRLVLFCYPYPGANESNHNNLGRQ